MISADPISGRLGALVRMGHLHPTHEPDRVISLVGDEELVALFGQEAVGGR
jgi:hypothetical protein